MCWNIIHHDIIHEIFCKWKPDDDAVANAKPDDDMVASLNDGGLLSAAERPSVSLTSRSKMCATSLEAAERNSSMCRDRWYSTYFQRLYSFQTKGRATGNDINSAMDSSAFMARLSEEAQKIMKKAHASADLVVRGLTQEAQTALLLRPKSQILASEWATFRMLSSMKDLSWYRTTVVQTIVQVAGVFVQRCTL